MTEQTPSEGYAVFDALVNKQFEAIFQGHLSSHSERS